jgi:hypothetical protein
MDGMIRESQPESPMSERNLVLYDNIKPERKYYIGGCYPYAVILDGHTGNQFGHYQFSPIPLEGGRNHVNYTSSIAIIGRWLNDAMIGVVRDANGILVCYNLLMMKYPKLFIDPFCQSRTPDKFGVDIDDSNLRLLASNVGMIYSSQRDPNKHQLYDIEMIKLLSQFQFSEDGKLLGKPEYFYSVYALHAAAWIYATFENTNSRMVAMDAMDNVERRLEAEREERERPVNA